MIIESLTNTIFENIPNSNGKFTKHFHDTYTIGLTHDGIFKSINENKSTLSYKYSTRVINPSAIHHGDSTSWKYTNFYPKIELLVEIYEQIFFEKKIPIFHTHIIEDPFLYKILKRFFISMFYKHDKMIIETNMIEALSYLLKNYTNTTKEYPTLLNENCVIKNSIELINDNIASNISLEELAINSHLSKYHFLRVFKKHTGLTPHQYILSTRTNKAKNLIIKGEKPLSASLNAGFSDQSHFIRNFKNIYGYSPKILQEKSNFILYN
ncbi:MAG: AraC family transcriptional regulator [Arcobacteraceae bacterium]